MEQLKKTTREREGSVSKGEKRGGPAITTGWRVSRAEKDVVTEMKRGKRTKIMDEAHFNGG